MNPNPQAAANYLKMRVMTATPEQLQMMLYDGALRFTSQAKQAAERRDIPARREAVSRTIAIVPGLQSTLDVERGGEVAVSLDRLYSFVLERLVSASFQQDPKLFDEVIDVLGTLREGWTTIAAPAGVAAAAR